MAATAVCAETLNADDRLNQIEYLLAMFEFVNVTINGEDDEHGADDGDDEDGEDSAPLLEDSEDDEDDDEELTRPYYCDACKLGGCPICDDGVDGRCDNCVEQFRMCKCKGHGCALIEHWPPNTYHGPSIPIMPNPGYRPTMQMEDLQLQHDVQQVYINMGKKADGCRHGELANKAVIDNGCTSNVCSHDWLQCFESLSKHRFARIPIEGHKKHFIFGAGKPKHRDLQNKTGTRFVWS